VQVDYEEKLEEVAPDAVEAEDGEGGTSNL
jgi:hypothetical protein